jgi:putative IMPACT (imprinted ancient) family translation regulator
MLEPEPALDVGLHQSELIVKKSQFLGYAQHVENWKEAQDYLDVVRAEHPKSNAAIGGEESL